MLERQCEVICTRTSEDGLNSRVDAFTVYCSHCEFKEEKRTSWVNFVLSDSLHLVSCQLKILFCNWNRISYFFQIEDNLSRGVDIGCEGWPAICKLEQVSPSVTLNSSLWASTISYAFNLRPCSCVSAVQLPTSNRKDQIHPSSHRHSTQSMKGKFVGLACSSNFIITSWDHHFCKLGRCCIFSVNKCTCDVIVHWVSSYTCFNFVTVRIQRLGLESGNRL